MSTYVTSNFYHIFLLWHIFLWFPSIAVHRKYVSQFTHDLPLVVPLRSSSHSVWHSWLPHYSRHIFFLGSVPVGFPGSFGMCLSISLSLITDASSPTLLVIYHARLIISSWILCFLSLDLVISQSSLSSQLLKTLSHQLEYLSNFFNFN